MKSDIEKLIDGWYKVRISDGTWRCEFIRFGMSDSLHYSEIGDRILMPDEPYANAPAEVFVVRKPEKCAECHCYFTRPTDLQNCKCECHQKDRAHYPSQFLNAGLNV